MDLEDIITLVLVLLLAVIPKKKRQAMDSEPVDDPDVNEVRKRIEDLKRQRNTNAQTSHSYETPLKPKPSLVKRNFSAYKHLPQQVKLEESISYDTVELPKVKISAVPKPINSIEKNIANKKTKLHEWIIGQVILGSPAFRKNYGNFFNR